MRHASLSILTGILVGTSYIPFPPWAIFFCFVPLWISWFEEAGVAAPKGRLASRPEGGHSSENSLRNIFWTGWLAQFVLTLIGFNWVAHTVHEFGHFPWPSTVVVLMLFCSFANLQVPLVGLAWFYFCKYLRIGPKGKIWSLPLFMCVGERLFPMIFDWHNGYTWLWAGFPAFQLADIFGFIGLSSIGLLFNGFFLWAWWKWRQKQIWWRAAAVPPVVFCLLNIWGYSHGLAQPPPDASKKILIVQANIGNEEKIAAEQGAQFRDVVINRFTELTQKGLHAFGAADFAIWPETAFPEIIGSPLLDSGYPLKLKSFLVDQKVQLITGGYSRIYPSGKITNSFFVLGNNGEWLTPPYHKTMLLAFGEYLPLGEYLPFVRKQVPEIGDFGRGPGPTVLTTGDFKIGAQICYEGLFDWFSRRQALEGAHMMVNLTNDSWFGKWAQPFQHGYMTLARAVEVRRPMVRSTNTGISTVALASGKIMELSPLHEEWFHLYDVPYASTPQSTIFMRWGFWIFPVFLFLGIILIALRSRTRE